ILIDSKVHSISGSDVEPQLKYAFTDRLAVAVISTCFNAADSGTNPIADISVPSLDPFTERIFPGHVNIVPRCSWDWVHWERRYVARDLNITPISYHGA